MFLKPLLFLIVWLFVYQLDGMHRQVRTIVQSGHGFVSWLVRARLSQATTPACCRTCTCGHPGYGSHHSSECTASRELFNEHVAEPLPVVDCWGVCVLSLPGSLQVSANALVLRGMTPFRIKPPRSFDSKLLTGTVGASSKPCSS